MGFLKYIGVAIFALWTISCGGLKLYRPLQMSQNDWPTYGRTGQRTNVALEEVVPPLTLEWENDITGGIGNGSPLVVDSMVIIGNLRGELYVLNGFTGKRIGWISLGDAIQGSPVVDRNIAFVATSNSRESLLAFDLLEGKPIWKKELGDIEVSPLLANDNIYVGNNAGYFFAVNRQRGELLWKFKLPENKKRKGIHSSPAAAGNIVVFGADDGSVYALDASSGKELWSVHTEASILAPPSIHGGNVYIGNLDGTVYALDLDSGKVRWKFNAGTSIYSGPAVTETMVLVGTTGGTLFALQPENGATIWTADLESVINSSAVISGGVAYVGTLRRELFGISLINGAIAWRDTLEGRVKTTPAIGNGRLYVATDNKVVLSFKGTR